MGRLESTVYYLLPKQAEFLFGVNEKDFHKTKDGVPIIHRDISCYQGGFGSGKTYCGSLKGLFLALKYPGIRGFVGASTQDLIDNTTKDQYIQHMDKIGFKEGIHYIWQDRKTLLKLFNGSIIYFKTLSNPDQYRSYNLGFVEFEEASQLTEYAFDTLLSRLRQDKHPDWGDHFCYHFFLHTNPGGMRGWIYKNFINPKTKKPGYRYINAPTSENIFLDEGYKDSLSEKYSAQQAMELLEGKDVDYDNTIAFPDFNQLNILDNIQFNPNEPLILTCDFNYKPMCWYLVQYVNGNWHVLRELVIDNVTTEKCCPYAQRLIDQFGVKSFYIMGDAAGNQNKTTGNDYVIMATYFQNRGYNVQFRLQKSNPLIKERLACLRGYIKNAKGVRRLFVDSSCKWLLYNFDECRNNLVNQGIKQPTQKEIEKDDNLRYIGHPIDAMSYPIWYLEKMKATTNNAIDKIE